MCSTIDENSRSPTFVSPYVRDHCREVTLNSIHSAVVDELRKKEEFGPISYMLSAEKGAVISILESN